METAMVMDMGQSMPQYADPRRPLPPANLTDACSPDGDSIVLMFGVLPDLQESDLAPMVYADNVGFIRVFNYHPFRLPGVSIFFFSNRIAAEYGWANIRYELDRTRPTMHWFPSTLTLQHPLQNALLSLEERRRKISELDAIAAGANDSDDEEGVYVSPLKKANLFKFPEALAGPKAFVQRGTLHIEEKQGSTKGEKAAADIDAGDESDKGPSKQLKWGTLSLEESFAAVMPSSLPAVQAESAPVQEDYYMVDPAPAVLEASKEAAQEVPLPPPGSPPPPPPLPPPTPTPAADPEDFSTAACVEEDNSGTDMEVEGEGKEVDIAAEAIVPIPPPQHKQDDDRLANGLSVGALTNSAEGASEPAARAERPPPQVLQTAQIEQASARDLPLHLSMVAEPAPSQPPLPPTQSSYASQISHAAQIEHAGNLNFPLHISREADPAPSQPPLPPTQCSRAAQTEQASALDLPPHMNRSAEPPASQPPQLPDQVLRAARTDHTNALNLPPHMCRGEYPAASQPPLPPLEQTDTRPCPPGSAGLQESGSMLSLPPGLALSSPCTNATTQVPSLPKQSGAGQHNEDIVITPGPPGLHPSPKQASASQQMAFPQPLAEKWLSDSQAPQPAPDLPPGFARGPSRSSEGQGQPGKLPASSPQQLGSMASAPEQPSPFQATHAQQPSADIPPGFGRYFSAATTSRTQPPPEQPGMLTASAPQQMNFLRASAPEGRSRFHAPQPDSSHLGSAFPPGFGAEFSGAPSPQAQQSFLKESAPPWRQMQLDDGPPGFQVPPYSQQGFARDVAHRPVGMPFRMDMPPRTSPRSQAQHRFPGASPEGPPRQQQESYSPRHPDRKQQSPQPSTGLPGFRLGEVWGGIPQRPQNLQQGSLGLQSTPLTVFSQHGQSHVLQQLDDVPPHLRGGLGQNGPLPPDRQLQGSFRTLSPRPQQQMSAQPIFQPGQSHAAGQDDVPPHLQQRQVSQPMMQGWQTSPAGLPPGFGKRAFSKASQPPHQTLSQVFQQQVSPGTRLELYHSPALAQQQLQPFRGPDELLGGIFADVLAARQRWEASQKPAHEMHGSEGGLPPHLQGGFDSMHDFPPWRSELGNSGQYWDMRLEEESNQLRAQQNVRAGLQEDGHLGFLGEGPPGFLGKGPPGYLGDGPPGFKLSGQAASHKRQLWQQPGHPMNPGASQLQR